MVRVLIILRSAERNPSHDPFAVNSKFRFLSAGPETLCAAEGRSSNSLTFRALSSELLPVGEISAR